MVWSIGHSQTISLDSLIVSSEEYFLYIGVVVFPKGFYIRSYILFHHSEWVKWVRNAVPIHKIMTKKKFGFEFRNLGLSYNQYFWSVRGKLCKTWCFSIASSNFTWNASISTGGMLKGCCDQASLQVSRFSPAQISQVQWIGDRYAIILLRWWVPTTLPMNLLGGDIIVEFISCCPVCGNNFKFKTKTCC